MPYHMWFWSLFLLLYTTSCGLSLFINGINVQRLYTFILVLKVNFFVFFVLIMKYVRLWQVQSPKILKFFYFKFFSFIYVMKHFTKKLLKLVGLAWKNICYQISQIEGICDKFTLGILKFLKVLVTSFS